MPPLPSDLGHYRVIEKLGEGGMGEVYRAQDTRLGRHVALKVLPQAFATDVDRLARFRREAQLLASLNHQNIAAIHGLDDAGGQTFLVLELVEGEDLAAHLRRGAMSVDDAIGVASQIAAALEAAHDKNIIHRDLKPANVKLTPDRRVKVLDFGLAKALDPASGQTDLAASPTMTSPAMTGMGIILGTAAYMSPEQARGRAVDKRADIWAFGCVLYEMLTGAQLFAGDTITDILASIVKTEPDWSRLPLETPPSIRRLLRRCLEKDPKDRLHDIADARLELHDREAAVALPALPQPASPTARRAFLGWIGLTALAGLAAGAAGGVLWRASRDVSPPQWTGVKLGGPEIAMYPRVSPDGQLIAFQAMVNGQSQVAVMRPGTGNWTVLTRDRTHGLVDTLNWSTDGGRIFYDRVTDNPLGIYSVPALGGDERLVIENAGSPLPLPDGSLLLLRINASRQPQLHRLRPGTGTLEPLPVLMSVNGRVTIRALRDGRVVLIGRPLQAPDGVEKLYVLRPDTGDLRRIGPDAGIDIRDDVAVPPDGKTVLLAVRDGSMYRVLRVAIDGPAAPQPVLTFLSRPYFDISPDGALYVSLMERPVEVLRFRDSGGVVERVAAVPGLAGANAVALPDGRVLVGARTAPRVLVAAAGKDPVAFVEAEADTRGPMTSLGARHAAIIIGSGPSSEIAIVATATGGIVKRLKAPPGIVSLAASPDGKVLYYTAGGSIFALAVEGGEPRTIGQGDSLTVDPASGDLIIRLDESERIRLVRLAAGGGPPQPIDVKGDLRLVGEALLPGAVRNGRLLLPVATADSWYWYAAVLDLRTGRLDKIAVDYFTDFHGLTWAADGSVLGTGIGVQSALWRFAPAK